MSHPWDQRWQLFWSCTPDWAFTAAAAAAAAEAASIAGASIVTMPDAIACSELGIRVHIFSVSVALVVVTGVVVMRRPCLWVVPSARVVAAAVTGFMSADVAPASKISTGIAAALMFVVSGSVSMVDAAAPVRPAMVGIAVAHVLLLALVVGHCGFLIKL